jgi:hypothetical protein
MYSTMSGTKVPQLFDEDVDYSDVNELVSLVVDRIPFQGTWFYVDSGMTSNIIFPDFNITAKQAELVGAENTTPGIGQKKVYKDSLLPIPSELQKLLNGATPNESVVKVLDIPGSDYDGADVKTIPIELPIGTFASFANGGTTNFFSVANPLTTALRVRDGDKISEFVESNYKSNPAVLRALSGASPTVEGSSNEDALPNLLDSLQGNSDGTSVERGEESGFSGPNKGLKSRGDDVSQAAYTIKLDLPVVVGDDGNAVQLYFNNETPPKGLPNGSYSIKTSDGLDQTVGYKQSYDLADYYVAYNPGFNDSLLYSAIPYDPDGEKDKNYSNLTGNPIDVRDSWDGSPNTGFDKMPSAIGVQTGLKDLVLRAYGDIAYKLSAQEQEEIEEAQGKLNKDLTSLADKIKASYLINPVFKNDPLFSGEAEGAAQFKYRAVASSLYQMATIIYYNYTQLVNPDTYTFTQIDGNYSEALKAGDADEVLEEHQKGIGQLFGQLSRAQLDWQGTIYSNFGAITEDNILKVPPYTLPWDAEFYQEYKRIRLKGNYDTFFNKTDVAAYFQGSLQDAVRYLIDLGTLNKDNKYTVNKPDKFVYLVGDSDVPYGPKVNTFPRPESPEDNSVTIQITSDESAGSSESSSSSTDVTYSAKTEASGWWYSASASTQGEYKESDSMSQAALSSKSQDITLSYTNMGQQPIDLGSQWFKPEILREAWNQQTTRSDANWAGGFGFYAPEDQVKYFTADLYYVSNYAFGDQDLSITLKSDESTESSTEHFDSYSQTTSVEAEVGWGPFSASAESSVSTSNEQRSSAFEAQSTSSGMQITARPLKAYQTEAIETANGKAKMLVAVEVTPIATASIKRQQQDSSAAARLPRLIGSSASLRSEASSRDNSDGDINRGGSHKGEFTLAAAEDYKKNRTNRYKLLGGDDHHFGGDGRDVVLGGRGDDRLIGLAGDDVLKGGPGSDTLYGGSGRNVLYGGDGGDYFQIMREYTKKGSKHIIMDASDQDRLVFSGYHPEDITTKNKGRIFAD